MKCLHNDVSTGEVHYGDHTAASVSNSAQGTRVGDVPSLVRSYAWIKRACAEVSVEMGALDERIGAAISQAADDVATGGYADQFPSPIVAGGGGTATNMNFNEVISSIATAHLGGDKLVHPNDHVNKSQSSNDTYPTAVALTLLQELPPVIKALNTLELALLEKAQQYEGHDHLGRTCLNDAVALPISSTHKAQAAALRRTSDELQRSVGFLVSVPLGGTVVGSGVGAPADFGPQAIRRISAISGVPLVPSPDVYDSMANADPYAAVGAAARRISVIVYKISSDLRLLASGPRGGFGEIQLPKVQAGSSIMPGKVNPTILEASMLCMLRVRAFSSLVDEAVDAGELEINVMLPVVLEALLEIFANLREATTLLSHKCIPGLSWNLDKVEANLTFAYDAKVALAVEVGYDMTDTEAQPRVNR